MENVGYLLPSDTEARGSVRNVLLSVAGLAPQVVTETIFALAVEGDTQTAPSEVHLLTTSAGKRCAEASLLRGKAWFHKLGEEYELPPIHFPVENIHVICDHRGESLEDIRTTQDNDAAADCILECVRILTSDSDCALHVSIAGGRKTMGYYTGYALSLFGRSQDRLSHVLVSPPFESLPDFFYPARYPRLVRSLDGRVHDASTAKVTLADIPFVRLRDGLPAGYLSGKESFSEAVRAIQRQVASHLELVIDVSNRLISAHRRVFRLPPRELAFLAWQAKRRMRNEEGIICPPEGIAESDLSAGFLVEYREVIGPMGSEDRTVHALRHGMSGEYFSQVKSRVNTTIRRELAPMIGKSRAALYLVSGTGRKGYQRFGLNLPRECIRFEEITISK